MILNGRKLVIRKLKIVKHLIYDLNSENSFEIEKLELRDDGSLELKSTNNKTICSFILDEENWPSKLSLSNSGVLNLIRLNKTIRTNWIWNRNAKCNSTRKGKLNNLNNNKNNNNIDAYNRLIFRDKELASFHNNG